MAGRWLRDDRASGSHPASPDGLLASGAARARVGAERNCPGGPPPASPCGLGGVVPYEKPRNIYFEVQEVISAPCPSLPFTSPPPHLPGNLEVMQHLRQCPPACPEALGRWRGHAGASQATHRKVAAASHGVMLVTLRWRYDFVWAAMMKW